MVEEFTLVPKFPAGPACHQVEDKPILTWMIWADQVELEFGLEDQEDQPGFSQGTEDHSLPSAQASQL